MSLQNKISEWLNDYLERNNLDSFIIGVSGGVDSAVTSTLCAMTGKKTIVVLMPIHQNPEETQRGNDHCEWLKDNFSNVEQVNVELSSTYDKLLTEVPSRFQTKLSLANTRARIRMSTLYLISGSSNGIVVGTGNKIEDFGVGFFTKYGDGGVDVSPIGDLMKSEVYQLGREIGVIQEILDAKPTDGLWDDGRTDEDQLGVSYDELEWAMNYGGVPYQEMESRKKYVLETYRKHRDANMHKMKSIPVFKRRY